MGLREKYIIGIDGGGTKTQAVLLDREGHELGRGRAGPANPVTVGRDAAAAAMRQAMQTALMVASNTTASPPTLEDVAGVGVGIAGVTGSQAWLEKTITGALPGAVVTSTHDTEIALVGALGARRGLVAIAGTGSSVYGTDGNGAEAIADGWGYLLGDEGSGFAIGQAALRVFLHVYDGRAAPCALAEAVGAHLNLSTREAIIHWAYGKRKSPRVQVREIAELARLVMEQAGCGDSDAVRIIEETAGALVLAIRGVWQKLALGTCRVGLAGGALHWRGVLAQAVAAQLAETLPDVTPSAPRRDAATGAAWMAMHALGWRTL